MVYSMRAAARVQKPIIVLDRPNPITGYYHRGSGSRQRAGESRKIPRPGGPGQAYALYPMPLRHGMTMGEMALFFNEVLNIHADLHVVPMRGWRRDVWFDLTGLPWVKPSPNMPSLQSAMLYPGLVAFEATNLSVGRGTPEAFQLSARRGSTPRRPWRFSRIGDSRRSVLRGDIHAAESKRQEVFRARRFRESGSW